MNLSQHLLVAALRVYRVTVSPVLGALVGPSAGCRFEPTCSAYALEAIRRHGAWRGTTLALRRLARCHPWGGCGHDPVPPLPEASPTPDLIHLSPRQARG